MSFQEIIQKKRVAVFFSGRGSNFASLAEFSEAHPNSCPYEIVLAIYDKQNARGAEVAQSHNIDARFIDYKALGKSNAEKQIIKILDENNIEGIFLAGFMRVLSGDFITNNLGKNRKIINIHPSVLPLYKGLNTHERAINDGSKIHGATVHHVVEELDSGKIIAQGILEILPSDSAETLAARTLKLEHIIYPYAICIEYFGSNIPDEIVSSVKMMLRNLNFPFLMTPSSKEAI